MEKAALEDPFLAEAIEGYAQRPAADIVPDIEDLKKRFRQGTDRGKTAFLPSRKIWWSAAAAILIVLGGAFTWYWLAPTENKIAQKKETTSVPENESRDTAQTAGITGAADSVIRESSEKKVVPLSPAPEKLPPQAPSPPPQRIKQVPLPKPQSKNDTVAPEQGFTAADRAATAKAVEQAQAIEEAERERSRTREPRSVSVSAVQSETSLPAPVNTIAGKITDPNNEPLPFVNIRVADSVSETYTDARGNFKLTSGNTSLVANLKAAGFQPKKAVLYAGVPVNIIMLQPDTGQWSEVVVSAYGTKKKKALSADERESTTAVPADGWKNYDIYLMNNTRLPVKRSAPVHGLVDVSFTVNKHRQLSDFKILHSTCSSCNQEAVRVIKEGPQWKLTGNTDTTKVTITVRF